MKLAVGAVARGGVDPEHPAQPECFGVVLHDLHLAVRNVFARDVESLRRSWIHVQVFGLGERGGRGELHWSRAPGGRCARGSGLRSLGGALRGRGCGGRGGGSAGRRSASLGMQQTRRHQEARREGEELRNGDQTAHIQSFLFPAPNTHVRSSRTLPAYGSIAASDPQVHGHRLAQRELAKSFPRQRKYRISDCRRNRDVALKRETHPEDQRRN